MSLLANLASDSSIADEKDSIGGSGPVDSGLYGCTIAMAYINKASSGALGLALTLKTIDGKDIRQTLWMTSGTAKGCKNYYEKDGEKHYLPGFTHANALCLLTVGKEISQLDTETKVINLYSAEAKAEVPTKVEVVMDLLNQEIIAGIIKQTVDKTKKNEATGAYEATGETREENEIDKFFRAKDRMTTAEIRAQATEAVFINSWDQKWTGKTKDRAKGSAAGLPGVPKLGGAPAAAAGTKKPTTSLFG
jgi:hypothetical protein